MRYSLGLLVDLGIVRWITPLPLVLVKGYIRVPPVQLHALGTDWTDYDLRTEVCVRGATRKAQGQRKAHSYAHKHNARNSQPSPLLPVDAEHACAGNVGASGYVGHAGGCVSTSQHPLRGRAPTSQLLPCAEAQLCAL